ncbi:MAG TPA: hypothetical protein VGG29_03640 [Caulobacteraceae bacterium]
MSEGPVLQDPDDTLDHSLDWSSWLLDPDLIATSSWSISPAGPTVDADGLVSSQASLTTTTVSGLQLGQVYLLTNRIVTEAGLRGADTIVLRGFPK